MHIHFIGIGGIGMSALARYFFSKGHQVSGSDVAESDLTRELAMLGMAVHTGAHAASHIPPKTNLVVYNPAISRENPELREARAKGIKVQSYARTLAPITATHQTIAVAGSHGKSTTTALTALALEDGHLDPTVLIGTKLKEYDNANFRLGQSRYLVLEADEYGKKFLQYRPFAAVLTNIDIEHMDTFKTVAGIEDAFSRFLARVPQDGIIVANRDDQRTRRVARAFGKHVTWYTLDHPDAKVVQRALAIPGKHNISNALAALYLARSLGVRDSDSLYAFSRFKGSWRRFELLGLYRGAQIISDYGHHPREISATIEAARERFPLRRIWCLFQPHHYERLFSLWDAFITAFDQADRVILLPVYEVSGREKSAPMKRKRMNAETLTRALETRGKSAVYAASFSDATRILSSELHQGDVVLAVGAGDIHTDATRLASTPNTENLIEALDDV